MNKPFRATPDTYILPSYFPVPGAGKLPVNAFVILAREPVLVDGGAGVESEEFVEHLRSIIDPRDLRWLWLTHDDADHTGSIQRVLELAPRARLATHALAALRQATSWAVPLDRTYALRPGDRLDVGDRRLTAVRPPTFDNPFSLGIYDDRSQALLSVDAFGAILPGEGTSATDFQEAELAQGMMTWAAIDSPWSHLVDHGRFERALDQVRRMGPKILLSSHLPPAYDVTESFLQVLAAVPSVEPFEAPNQEMFQQMLALLMSPAQP